MACKYQYNNQWYSKEELVNKLSQENSNFKTLYQNLVNEITNTETGRKVLDRIKRDYNVKTSKYQKLDEENDINHIESIDVFKIGNNEYKYEFKEFEEYSGYYPSFTKNGTEIEFEEFKQAYNKNIDSLSIKYTLEEQQEEAIVELLGLMTAEKLDKVKDGKLISLLKRLLKEMKAFMRSLINQKEVEIDKLPDNMTLGDLSDLLAYSNSKLILPGYEVEYTTPDNEKFKTYAEASKHISDLAKSVENVDLSDVSINDIKIDKNNLPSDFKNYYTSSRAETAFMKDSRYNDEYNNKIQELKDKYAGKFIVVEKSDYGVYPNTTENQNFYNTKEEADNVALDKSIEQYKKEKAINGFIEKNREYEQSKEIIEEWKKVNNIVYNPEEIYSRGQEFSSVVGAYSSFDVNLMMQNLLSHIEDNEKAGGKFAISAYTKPIDKQIGHLEGGGGKIKFKLYPQSSDILWAANADVYSGSVWDASEKVNKDKKSELLGVSYTKYPLLQNIHAVQPNLASIIDDLAHHHNELGISLTGNNFRLEYDEDIPYSTKKIIDSINSILDQKYGKLVKPEIKEKNKREKWAAIDTGDRKSIREFENKEEAEKWINESKADAETYGLYLELGKIKEVGIQPTQTNETLKESLTEWTDWGEKFKRIIYKEHTSQALINTKIARLKEVAKKYPRSLIRSEVRPINNSQQNYGFDPDELPFQKLSKSPKEILQEKLNEQVKNNKQVVFDTTNLTKDKRLPFVEAIKKAIPNANIQYKLMELNPELAKQRIKADIAAGKNRANVHDATIDRHADSYKQMLEDIKNEPISNFEITPQQKQQATFMFSEFLDVYLQDFEQVEKILKEEKVIDKKCS